MIKPILIVFIGLWFVGCGSESGSPSSQKQIEDPVKPPVVVSALWGQLDCQKNKSCQNFILNHDAEELVTFFIMQFPEDLSMEGKPARRSFYCGLDFVEKWLDQFPGDHPLTEAKQNQLSGFARTLLDVTRCTNHHDVVLKMDQYFTNTKEYKNEL